MLVNNDGGQFVRPAEDMSSRGFGAVKSTNLQGTFVCCREAHTQYMREHGGSIVDITLGNRNGMPQMVHSGAARTMVLLETCLWSGSYRRYTSQAIWES